MISPAHSIGRVIRAPLFWILLLAAALRLVNLDAPVIGMHSWRQADTAAVARNFHENGYDLLHPQVDFGGAGPGYVEMEFPLYSYVVAVAYDVTGVREWWGRIISIACWVALVAAMHALGSWAGGERVGRWTAIFAAFLPLNLYYGRAVMPEAMMLAGIAGGLVFFRRWLERGRPWDLLASWACIAVACLLKIPSLYIGLPLAWLAWQAHGWAFLRRPAIWGYALALLAAVAAWYGHAHLVGRESGISFGVFDYGSDKWGKWNLLLTWHYWNSVLFKSIAERHLAWGGLPLLLIGLFLPRTSRRMAFFDAWLVAVLVYLLMVQGGNLAHEYYQLPVVLPTTFLMARGVDWLLCGLPRRRVAGRSLAMVLIAVMIVLGGFRWADYLGREDRSRSTALAFARHVAAHSAVTERGVFLNQGDPTVPYLARRKGWFVRTRDLERGWLDDRVGEGAAFFAAPAGEVPEEILAMGEVLRSADGAFVIVRLDGSSAARNP